MKIWGKKLALLQCFPFVLLEYWVESDLSLLISGRKSGRGVEEEREGRRERGRKGWLTTMGPFLDRENENLKVGNFTLTRACGFLDAQ